MKQIFLLPPSEGKNSENHYETENLSFPFEKPLEIGKSATEKDLKCSGKRFEEGIFFNKNIESGKTTEAINRYSGVMFDTIDFENISEAGKIFFNEHFLILSGMYGIVKPQDKIANYKLPIETKGLYQFWGEQITKQLSELQITEIINFLPISYAKLIGANEKTKSQEGLRNILLQKGIKLINVEFQKDGKKLSHGVKKVKGEFIKNICKTGKFDYKNYDFEERNGMIFVSIGKLNY